MRINKKFYANREEISKDIKSILSKCIIVHNKKWVQVEALPKKFGNWHTTFDLMPYARLKGNGESIEEITNEEEE